MHEHIDLLEVYKIGNKIRLGTNGDGGYVISDLSGNYDAYISCGVADEEGFTRDFLTKYNYLKRDNCFAFDGTINDYPWSYTNDIQFVKKNIDANKNDEKHTTLTEYMEKYDNIFLNMDIEGAEWEWLNELDEKYLNKCKQITLEFHGLCFRYDKEWKIPTEKQFKCFKKLKNTHYIIHAHGNTCNFFANGLPNVIELTFVRKNCFSDIPMFNNEELPSRLDFVNSPGRQEFDLNHYPFRVINPNNQIIIGPSSFNTKIIPLDKEYNSDTIINFFHRYPDTFSYSFKKNILSVKRTDSDLGWGQYLIGYL